MRAHGLWWLLALTAGAALPCAAARPAALYQTASQTADRLARKADVPFEPGPAPAAAWRVRATGARRQTVHGFGGAFTEATAVALAGLRNATLQQAVLAAYFGADGLHYSLCRVHMGSCDYCNHSYSCDDTPGTSNNKKRKKKEEEEEEEEEEKGGREKRKSKNHQGREKTVQRDEAWQPQDIGARKMQH